MEFFPDHIQKHIHEKLMHCFEPDRPYMLKNVEKIKDKFREWDVYKIQTLQDHLKNNCAIRRGDKQRQVVNLDR